MRAAGVVKILITLSISPNYTVHQAQACESPCDTLYYRCVTPRIAKAGISARAFCTLSRLSLTT